MSRIEGRFAALAAAGRKALIPYITAGDPSLEVTLALMHELAAAGADVIELGVPFSDPQADGPTIQRAAERALARGSSLRGILDTVGAFRQRDSTTPVVLMGYVNPVEAMGYATFTARAADAGVDGVLLVDLPPEESRAFVDMLASAGLDPIYLLSPTTTEARIGEIAKLARGYVYYVSLTGVTGAKHLQVGDVSARMTLLRKHLRVPIGVGFGIRDAQSACAIARVADAVVIGSRIVEEIEGSLPGQETINVGAFVREIRQALDADADAAPGTAAAVAPATSRA
ncbi:MAG: tryptophan synthase subunit alpha [Proteobacteria bacterium]|nr:tryptophan synthase subunit alpha [Burkholderiales bacterium]